MIIFLNGTDFSDYIDGKDVVSVSHSRKNKRGVQSKSVSNEFFITGPAYDLIKSELIDSALAKTNTVELIIYDDCCLDDNGNPFEAFKGVIRADTISWCYGECSVKATAIENTDDTLILDCFQSTIVADDRNGFRSQNHPRVTYCNELRPEWLHDVIIILGIIVNIILAVLSPIVFLLSLIVQVIAFIANLIPGVNVPADLQNGILDDYTDMINQLNLIITGCGRQHPSPLVRSYINNVCTICDSTFTSSILNNPSSDYYNTVYVNAPVEKGTRDTSVKYIEQNQPIKNGEIFLQELCQLFNADYRVKNGNLEFERLDYFWTGNIFVNYLELKEQGLIENQLCYSWRKDEFPAYARFEYLPDPVEVCGNEAKDRFCDIVEWNNPYSSAQRGSSENLFPFGMSRFRNDGIDRDVLATWQNAPFLSGIIGSFDTALLMEKGICFQPKLLIWDGLDVNDARTKKFNVSGFSVPYAENYNFPYMFNEHNCSPNQFYASNQANMGIYGRFHAMRNPKCNVDKGREFSFSFKFNCDHIRNFDVWGNVELPDGTGRILSAEIDYTNRIIKINGEI